MTKMLKSLLNNLITDKTKYTRLWNVRTPFYNKKTKQEREWKTPIHVFISKAMQISPLWSIWLIVRFFSWNMKSPLL